MCMCTCDLPAESVVDKYTTVYLQEAPAMVRDPETPALVVVGGGVVGAGRCKLHGIL